MIYSAYFSRFHGVGADQRSFVFLYFLLYFKAKSLKQAEAYAMKYLNEHFTQSPACLAGVSRVFYDVGKVQLDVLLPQGEHK